MLNTISSLCVVRVSGLSFTLLMYPESVLRMNDLTDLETVGLAHRFSIVYLKNEVYLRCLYWNAIFELIMASLEAYTISRFRSHIRKYGYKNHFITHEIRRVRIFR